MFIMFIIFLRNVAILRGNILRQNEIGKEIMWTVATSFVLILFL